MLLADTTWRTLKDHPVDVAVLPWGATEAHNTHLPYGTDTIQAEALGARAVTTAAARGARVLLLPAIPFGVQTGQRDIPFCLNLNPSTQATILSDLCASLAQHAVRTLVILNGHGGNDFKQSIRELQPATPVFLCQVNWYTVVDPGLFFDEPGDHAGELETSVMLHVAPHLVAPLETAGTGAARRARIRGFREGWAWAPRQWTQVTDDTGVGNPAAATAEKGARYVAALTEKLAEFIVDLCATEPSQMYE